LKLAATAVLRRFYALAGYPLQSLTQRDRKGQGEISITKLNGET